MTDAKPKPASKNPIAQSLLQLAGQNNVITVRRAFVDFTGTLESAMLLDQLLYWTPRSTMDGWIAKKDEEFQQELCLKRYSVRAARELLVEMKIVETGLWKYNGAPTVHYRVLLDELLRQWTEHLSLLSENEQSESAKSDNEMSGIARTLTETTPETTKVKKEEEELVEKIQLSPELQSALQELGVYVSIFKDIRYRIYKGWSEADIFAVINWMKATRGKKDKASAARSFVTRIREGTAAPNEYYPRERTHVRDEDDESDQVQIADETVTPAVTKWWKRVKEELVLEMTRVSFATYVEPTYVTHYSDLQMHVVASNDEIRDWLESRLASTVNRLLIGITNGDQVTVKFVVGVAMEAEA